MKLKHDDDYKEVECFGRSLSIDIKDATQRNIHLGRDGHLTGSQNFHICIPMMNWI